MTDNGQRLSGKSILVTGGTRGIGRAVVEKFAREGANVMFSYISSEDAAKTLISETETKAVQVIGMRADVRDRDQVDQFTQTANAKFGGIDVVINNAHKPYQRKWFEETSWDEFQRELDTLVKGPFNMIQSALPYMKARGGGQIINVSSTLAQAPEFQHSFYTTAKSALIGLTRSLALELGKYGIRANVVTPGPMETDHNADLPKELMKQLAAETPLHARMATCEEVAGAIMLLTLPEAAMVTGSDMQTSGGFAMF